MIAEHYITILDSATIARMIKKILITSFLFIFVTTSLANNLPDLGDPSQNLLSSSDMRELSRSFMQDLQQQVEIIADPLLNDYIETLGQRLAQHSGDPEQKFDFLLISNPDINAFAGPSGIIGVNSGLLLTSQTESELAAVLAHEVAHVSQHHLVRTMAEAKHIQIPMLLTSIAAIAISGASGGLGQGALLGTIAGFQQHMINFTRSHEKEADRIGMEILHKSKFNPKSMADFFKRLQDTERLYYAGNTPEILRTHPVTPRRIADANNRAQLFKKEKYHNSLYYQFMKERCRVLTSSNPQKTLNYYKHNKDSSLARNYGYALALIRSQHIKLAEPVIKFLLKQEPDELHYQLLAAEYFTAAKNLPQSLKILKNAFHVYPDSYPLIIEYGKTLLRAGKAKEAENLLQQAVYDEPENVTYLLLLAQAHAANKHQAAAYFTQAQALLISDEPQLAYRQLEIAKRLVKKDRYLRLQIKALMREINPKYN